MNDPGDYVPPVVEKVGCSIMFLAACISIAWFFIKDLFK